MAKSEKQKMITGELFNVYDPELVAERGVARDQVEALNALGESDPAAGSGVAAREDPASVAGTAWDPPAATVLAAVVRVPRRHGCWLACPPAVSPTQRRRLLGWN